MGELRALEKYTHTESVTNVKTSITGWWYTYPSEKYESQLGLLFPIYVKIKHAPNHQPDNIDMDDKTLS